MRFYFPRTEPPAGVPSDDWISWKWQFQNGLRRSDEFAAYFDLNEAEVSALATGQAFQVKCTPYYAVLAAKNLPIRKMTLPGVEEGSRAGQQIPDPLGERKHSPCERLIHRYPDRVLFLVTDQCSLYCRYCLRKHFTGQDQAFIGSREYVSALHYLRAAKGVREVILSGGDPLTLSDSRLEQILGDLRAIEHLEIIRIASRMPVVCPMRLTGETVSMMRRFKPIYFMTHFNHPRELSHEAAEALEGLVDHGIPVFNQMVLLNGINNHPAIVQALSRRLLYLRVKPYYMFQCDPSVGTEHFRTSIEDSMAIQRELWGRLSGLAMPNLSLDIPGGGGKVGIVPDFAVRVADGAREYCGWDKESGIYQNPKPDQRLTPADLEDYLSEWEQIKLQAYGGDSSGT